MVYIKDGRSEKLSVVHYVLNFRQFADKGWVVVVRHATDKRR